MESFGRREDVLTGSPNRQFQSSPKSKSREEEDSDMDFSDVFGGPPRRFSMQEMRVRYSFGESSMESEQGDAKGKSWSGFDNEKPVFGEENNVNNRRTYQNDDFFDDIFKGGDDSSKSYTSPRISRDVFGSSSPSGSRVMSPSRPLPPKAEPFSLPAKLTKAIDLLVFASPNRSLHKGKDGITNGASYAQTSNVSLSRFASQTSEVVEETREDKIVYRQSPSSREVSPSSEELLYETKSDEKDKGESLTKNSENVNASIDSLQFHFSIYKWAGKGMPSLIPLIRSNKLRSKDKRKMERSSSSNARIHCDSRESPELEEQIIAVDTETVSSKVKDEKQDETSNGSDTKSQNTVKETHPGVPEPDIAEEEEFHSKHELDSSEKTKKEIYVEKEQVHMPEPKPLCAHFDEEKQGKGYTTDGEVNKVKIPTAANEDAKVSNTVKKTNLKGIKSNKAEETKASLQGSATKSGEAIGKSAVKGKVREFVKIFKPDTSAKPKSNSEIPSQSSRWKGKDINETQNEINNATKRAEKVRTSNTEKMQDASFRVDTNPKVDKVKQDAQTRSSVHKTDKQSAKEKDAPIFSDSLSNNREAKVENRDESSQGDFVVEELSQILDKDLQTQGDSVDIKGLDKKIQQWSNGRNGNIRSLLSTLQLVLWPESGWKPVPLVNIIEGSAVKRSYQKALLYLHPDKLQQKGATSDQKYMAEKVFDILQEAWDHFNSLEAI